MFDTIENAFDKSEFPRQDWTYYIYNSDKIELGGVLPPDMTKPYGKFMTMRVYINGYHTRYYVFCRSRSGLVVFLYNMPIY